jgi:hypothetical protein
MTKKNRCCRIAAASINCDFRARLSKRLGWRFA